MKLTSEPNYSLVTNAHDLSFYNFNENEACINNYMFKPLIDADDSATSITLHDYNLYDTNYLRYVYFTPVKSDLSTPEGGCG